MIPKIQTDQRKYRRTFYYYNRARDAMFDVVKVLAKRGYKEIYIPGYIGWSPGEGSGIFDPLSSISDLRRYYYKMTENLKIDTDDLYEKMQDHAILLIVNYFGFRDENLDRIIETAHKKGNVVIEDNAHGFFTYFCKGKTGADITFFSLHKMFPFRQGGGLIIANEKLNISPVRNIQGFREENPFDYDIAEIAKRRIDNYSRLMRLSEGKEQWFVPLPGREDVENNVPQTFPVKIIKGNRDEIYQLMNDKGYGVVSLYHTMIEELRNKEHENACALSSCIMNLPVHQDLDPSEYELMITALIEACEKTAEQETGKGRHR